jgi:pyruvate dehydrogenase E1 component beta subunit
MFVDFMGCCMDELFNQAAKLRYMNGGKCQVPMVLRTPCGAGQGAAAQHSQSVESWFTHIPGVKTVMPSTPADAKGLMMAAIKDKSVMNIGNKQLVRTRRCAGRRIVVPHGKRKSNVKCPTLLNVAWAWMLQKAQQR